MKKLSDLQMATASSLMAGAMQAAVIQTLIRNHVLTDEEGHEIWTSIDALHEVAKALEGPLGEAEAVKLGWKPQNETVVTGDDAEKLMKLIDQLEEDDDVQTVWGNYDVPDEELEKLA